MQRKVFESKSHRGKVGNALRLPAKKKFGFNAKDQAIVIAMQGEVPMRKSVAMKQVFG